MQDKLRNLVADLLRVEPAQLAPGTLLDSGGLQGSVGRARLDAALRRRLGITTPAAYAARSYGELESCILPGGNVASALKALSPAPTDPVVGESVSQLQATPAAANGGAAGISCGIDIELLENLPTADDYWQHEFYQASFTPTEIAYCLMQESPAMHFAARWCAKEALKKCEPGYASHAMATLEVARHEHGATSLRDLSGAEPRLLPHAVSISHTAHAAIAVVIRPPAIMQLAQPSQLVAPQTLRDDASRPSRDAVPALLWLACGVALLVSLVALWVSLRH